jgi:hypothetical protein
MSKENAKYFNGYEAPRNVVVEREAVIGDKVRITQKEAPFNTCGRVGEIVYKELDFGEMWYMVSFSESEELYYKQEHFKILDEKPEKEKDDEYILFIKHGEMKGKKTVLIDLYKNQALIKSRVFKASEKQNIARYINEINDMGIKYQLGYIF